MRRLAAAYVCALTERGEGGYSRRTGVVCDERPRPATRDGRWYVIHTHVIYAMFYPLLHTLTIEALGGQAVGGWS